MKKNKIAVLTSGGDAPGMNACIRAVVRTAIFKGFDVYGVYQGYDGLIKGEIKELSMGSVGDIIHKGGTILRTARSDEFRTPEGRSKAYEQLRLRGIDNLVVIGGDGTITGAYELSKQSGIRVIGIPGTIDNDLGFTDYTIGFDTAVNTALSAIGNIRDTSTSMGRTTVIEVMGRHCGDIALYAGLAGGAEDILIPEEKYDLDSIADEIKAGVARGKLHSIIIKAEGVDDATDYIARCLEEKTGCETKTVLLGYIQRGGNPTAGDRILASRLGYEAVCLIENEAPCSVVGISGEDIVSYPIQEALSMTKQSHADFMTICHTLI